MGVVPEEEKKAIVEEATINTLREIQLRSKTIDQLVVVDKVGPTDKVELNGRRSATIETIADIVQDAAAPEWEDLE